MKKCLRSGRIVFLLILTSVSIQVHAQKTPRQLQEMRQRVLADPKVQSLTISEERQTPSLITLKGQARGYEKRLAMPVLAKYLNVRNGLDYLVADKETKLFNNIEVVEYQQFFKGVKVEYSKFKAFVKNGNVEFFNGSWYDIPAELNTEPRLTKDAALRRAKSKVNARKYATEDLEEKISKATNARIKEALQKELADVSPKGELVIVKDFTEKGIARVKLAYKFDIYATEPVSRSWIYIDADQGKVLLVDPIIKHVNEDPVPKSVATTVETRYAGKRNIYVKQVTGNDPNSGQLLTSSHPSTEVYVPGSSTWVLVDDTRGAGVETYDLNQTAGTPVGIVAVNNFLYANGKSFTDADNNWTTAEHRRSGTIGGAAEAENDDIAWDAHWGAGVVYDYWKQVQNRLSFDNQNSKIKSFVHTGQAYDNAYWNGSVMSYGDGSYAPPLKTTGFRALTSLDVCGHEIGHGVCTFTSNLVYAMESGAMNEGFSDVWASCIEYFAIKSIDPALGLKYKPFYIGEQIAPNPAVPLRRMDNPKAKGNPDTYGGQNWTSQDCTPDDVTNDHCGVHNNSGVLNKWFYLITVGSGAGSGPDAAYAGEDDGINDLGNSYQVTGLGFAMSEKLAYMTEILLSSNATYAEAREVSIQVATEISGDPCSNLVKQVANAWYAVGVGDAFVEPCTPASVTFGFLQTGGLAVSEGNGSNGCNLTKKVSVPVLLPANSTATAVVSGTAAINSDYTLTSASISNSTGSMATGYFEINIKNDGAIETDETVVLKITVSNAGSNPVNNSFTLTILEDDATPIIGSGTKELLSETFTRADGFNDPAGWTEVLEIPVSNAVDAPKGLNQWGVFGNKLAITGKDQVTGTALPAGFYNNLSESKTYIKSPLIDATGLSRVSISFDFHVQGEFDPQKVDPAKIDFERLPAFDYMAVMYSLDGVNFTELNTGDFRQFVSAIPGDGSFTGVLPASLANKKFYLAFRWYNDTNAGGPESVTVDNLMVSGSLTPIENHAGHNGRENLGAGQEIYFYSSQDREVLGKLKNNSAKDYGCTNVFVEKAGDASFNLYQGRDGLHKVADKIIRIETSLIYKGANTVTLYYTEEQLRALEFATGRSRSEFSVFQVNDAAYTGASSQNTKKYAASYAPLNGGGGSYTINFNDKMNGSYALGYTVSILGQSTLTAAEKPAESLETSRWKFENVFPNPGTANVHFVIQAPQQAKLNIELVNIAGQLVHRQIENVQAGKSQILLPTAKLSTGSYLIRVLNSEGKLLNAQSYIKN